MSRGIEVYAVADGVYAAAVRQTALRREPVRPDDLPAEAGVPGWRQRERVAARVLLRHLLSQTAGPDAAAQPVCARVGGQPYLPGRTDLAISLSHAEGWVAAAVNTGGGSVGVDVAPPRPVSDRFVRHCCTPSGQEALAGMPGQARDMEVAWIWSVQEACVKATGRGLAEHPWTIPVEPEEHSGRWRHLQWSALRDVFPVPVSCAYEPRGGGTT